MPREDRFAQLGSFLSVLSDRFGWEFDREDFDDRFLLQKYVFFAQRLGFDLPYQYNVYVFGAYSPDLAQDYYSEELPDEDQIVLPSDSFDMDSFENLVRERDSRWLEIASTLVLYYERFQFLGSEKRREKAIEKTQSEKDTTERTAQQIYENLIDFGLVE